jgi:hypothetical protein
VKFPVKKFLLLDSKDEFFGEYDTAHAAHEDVAGPCFHKGFRIVEIEVRKVKSKKYKYQEDFKPWSKK